jgi:predicted ATP-grasp superfamily ATP-dependent carboligase
MSARAESTLIAALSGRALAQSAQAASIPVTVLDVFGDADTQSATVSSVRVGNEQRQIDRKRLLDAAERLCPPHRFPGLVYGAGFESYPQTLADLAAGRELLGNDPSLLRDISTPRYFFSLLDRLGIPYPEVTYRRPADPRGWLAKRPGSCGGAHVMPAHRVTDSSGYYFQRKLPGRVMSVLFLANGHRMAIVGISEQWRDTTDSPECYRYGGAAAGQNIGSAVHLEVTHAIQELVQRLCLRGLNGMDIIVDKNSFHVLEVNARPPATAELYDPGGADSLFRQHLACCRGDKPSCHGRAVPACAHAVVYADRELVVPAGTRWPDWCSDIPVANSSILPGEPVCTVHAIGNHVPGVRQVLNRRSRMIRDMLPSNTARQYSTRRFAAGG